MNELVLFNTSITASALAVLDTIGMTLRPCRYRSGSLHRAPELAGTTALKLIRLWCEATTYGEGWSVSGMPEIVQFSDFDLALHLGKSRTRGIACAREFVSQCSNLGLLASFPRDLSLEELLEELSYLDVGESSPLRGIVSSNDFNS